MAHYRHHLVWSVDLNVNKKNYIYIKYIYKSISPKQISLTTHYSSTLHTTGIYSTWEEQAYTALLESACTLS